MRLGSWIVPPRMSGYLFHILSDGLTVLGIFSVLSNQVQSEVVMKFSSNPARSVVLGENLTLTCSVEDSVCMTDPSTAACGSSNHTRENVTSSVYFVLTMENGTRTTYGPCPSYTRPISEIQFLTCDPNSSTLMFVNVGEHVKGNWTCTDDRRSQYLDLDVIYQPVLNLNVLRPPPATISPSIGKSKKYTVIVKANPAVVNYSSLCPKNGSNSKLALLEVGGSGKTSFMLKIENVEYEDYGDYVCEISNKVGTLRLNYKIIPTALPNVTSSDVSVFNVGGRITMKWKYFSGKFTKYGVLYCEVDDQGIHGVCKEMLIDDVTRRSVDVPINSKKKYSYYFKLLDGEDVLFTSIELKAKDDHDSLRTPTIDGAVIGGIVVGVVAGLLVLAAIIILCVRFARMKNEPEDYDTTDGGPRNVIHRLFNIKKRKKPRPAPRQPTVGHVNMALDEPYYLTPKSTDGIPRPSTGTLKSEGSGVYECIGAEPKYETPLPSLPSGNAQYIGLTSTSIYQNVPTPGGYINHGHTPDDEINQREKIDPYQTMEFGKGVGESEITSVYENVIIAKKPGDGSNDIAQGSHIYVNTQFARDPDRGEITRF